MKNKSKNHIILLCSVVVDVQQNNLENIMKRQRNKPQIIKQCLQKTYSKQKKIKNWV